MLQLTPFESLEDFDTWYQYSCKRGRLCPVCASDAIECRHEKPEMRSALENRLMFRGELKPATSVQSAGLSTDAAARKAAPIASGLLFYFPNACAAVSALSKVGNEQHNPGQPMHWAFDKSQDEADCVMRHLAQSGTIDTDGVPHTVKVAWRALALLERELLAANPELQPGKNVRNFSRGR